jgi:hypothetical protein
MPAHDWTKVNQGIFHDLHNSWIVVLKNALNSGVLPPDYYALSEQVAGDTAPDVITLDLVPRSERATKPAGAGPLPRVGALLEAAPQVSIVARTESLSYAALRKTLSIRHGSDHEVVALIEIVSRANKASRAELERFLVKAQSALRLGIHLLIIDLHPPGRLDPLGLHGALWTALAQPAPKMPADRPLLAAAYEAGTEITAYVEPFAVGDPVPNMPLFLRAGGHVIVPLASTYDEAFTSLPAFWRERVNE